MNELSRFVKAQEGCFDQALAEIRAGRKRTHWMWFIFPQLAGLGFSPTARFYAIMNLDEAQRYLADPVLGPRLTEITQVLLGLSSRNARAIFGYPDDLKLRSSMTLFSQVSGCSPVFAQVIDEFFDGQPDRATLTLLGS
ncbi:MAG: DUF1810 domain-containing protein [Propionibacteriaceae bacterium]|nr:DUF1810 domain-containing protein [Propionibacteriaceae bacterium]